LGAKKVGATLGTSTQADLCDCDHGHFALLVAQSGQE